MVVKPVYLNGDGLESRKDGETLKIDSDGEEMKFTDLEDLEIIDDHPPAAGAQSKPSPVVEVR